MGRGRITVRDLLRLLAAWFVVSAPAAWPADVEEEQSQPDAIPELQAAPPELLERCLTKSELPRAGPDRIRVVVTVSPDGKAGNPRFPPEAEPWQQETVRCALELFQFNPATHEGVPVPMDVSIPIDFRLSEAPVIVPPRLKQEEMFKFSDCYAPSARRAGAEGQIQLKLTVEADGRVSKHELQPGVEPWQKSTAECLIPRMRFEPATRNGVPFATELMFPLSFSLKGNAPLTLAKLTASSDDIASASRTCYPSDRQQSATPHFRVTVNVRGWSSQVVLVKSSGDKKLDAAGACIIKKLRFDPAKRGDQPVMSTLLVPIEVNPPSSP